MDKDPQSLPPASTPPKEAPGTAVQGYGISENGLAHPPYSPPANNPPYGVRQDGETFDLSRLLNIIKRRWPVMLGIFALATAVGVFTLLRSKAIYESVATLELTPPQQSAADISLPGMAGFGGANSPDLTETQLENLRGFEVGNRAMKVLSNEKGISPQQLQSLARMAAVNVAQMGTTRLVTVGVQTYDPKAAAALANEICRSFIVISKRNNGKTSHDAVEYVTERMDSVQRRLSEAQSKLKNFKKKTGIFSISDAATALGSRSADLQKDLEQSNAERAAAQAKLQGLRRILSSIPSNKVVPTNTLRNPAVTNLQNQLTQLELDRTIAKRDYTPTSRKIQAIDNQIAALRSQLREQAQTIVSGWQPDPSRAPVASDAAETQSQLWSLDARIGALQKQTAAAKQSLTQLPDQEYNSLKLTNEAQVLQQTYQLLNERLQGLKIQEEGSAPDGRLANEAQPSLIPVAPNKPRLLLYTMGVGLLAALGVGLLLDLMDDHIYSEEDVHHVTGLPVLVQVPYIRQSAELNLTKSSGTKSGGSIPLLETFRMLRTNIRLSMIDRPVRALAVTSSVPGEGKSHTALNLAVAAANSGERVILVDLDLRRPSVHRLCELPNTLGFSSVVTNQCSLEEAMQDTSVPGLRVLTSGPVPPNPFRLLNSQTARSLIEGLTNDADLVIIDTPPVLAMADALLASSWVDGTLLVISSSEMRKRDVARSVDTLLQNNTEVLGTILTKVSSSVDGYYSYYGYNHYFDEIENEDVGENKSLPAESK